MIGLLSDKKYNYGAVLNCNLASGYVYGGSGIVVKDLSKLQNTCYSINTPVWSTNNGGGFVFNGTNQYLYSINHASLNLQSHTFEAWIKLSSLGSRRVIICTSQSNEATTSHAYWLEVNDSNKLQTLFGNTTGSGGVVNQSIASITTNITHVACIRNNTNQTIEFIINGVSDGVMAWGKIGTVSSTTRSLGLLHVQIGKSALVGYGFPFNGSIYGWEMHNIALSATRVKQNFLETKNRFGI